MKKLNSTIIKTLLLLFLAIGASCEGEEESPTLQNDETTNYYGSWKRNGMETYVKFEGSTATTCSPDGVQTVGTFNSSAPSMTFVIQGETITFPLDFSGNTLLIGVPDQAIDTNTAQYYSRSDNFPCDGGGGNEDGTLMFWVESDFGCGPISVTVNSHGGGTITGYYATAPDCGASSSANFSLPAGTYRYSASCSEYTWDGSVTIAQGQCFKMRLTL
jgi:hypothetical protein